MGNMRKKITLPEGNAHFTNYRYLSIDKSYLNNTKDEVIIVGNVEFDIDKLKSSIDYSDNAYWYRWAVKTWKRCTI